MGLSPIVVVWLSLSSAWPQARKHRAIDRLAGRIVGGAIVIAACPSRGA